VRAARERLIDLKKTNPILDQFLREECTTHVRQTLETALASSSGPVRFEFNRFEVTLEREDGTVCLQDVLDDTQAGVERVTLSVFAKALASLESRARQARRPSNTDGDTLAWLQDWYRSQWDGEWKHDHGIRIDTLDTPGWSVVAPLPSHLSPAPISERRGEHDWLECKVKDGQFHGHGGPQNLQEMLEVLRRWSAQAQGGPS
jgi:Immunity protein 53